MHKDFIARLVPAMSALGKAPCDGCEHKAKCGALKLACLDYALWQGITPPVKKNRPADPTAPERRWYDAVFVDSQKKELQEYVLGRVADMPLRDMVDHYGLERMQSALDWRDRKPTNNKWRMAQWDSL